MPRYIDADILPKLFDEEYKETRKLIEDGETHLENLAEGFSEAARVIRFVAPTADVQEVRHGRWIVDKETGCLICSECGHFTDEIIGDYTSADEEIAKALSIPKGSLIHRSMNPFYCSACGAKMDGKDDEK